MSSLADAYARLKQGTLWNSTGKCRGYAAANPGEAAKLDAYVNALVSGSRTPPPVLASATGQGIAGLIAAGFPAAPPPPPVTPVPSDRPASFFTGPLGANNLVPPAGSAFLGSMFGGVGYSWDQQKAQVANRESAMGRDYDVIHVHFSGALYESYNGVAGCESNVQAKVGFANAGSIPLVAWTPDYTVAEMNAGKADAIWGMVARYLSEYAPHLMMLRAFNEFDGGSPASSPRYQYGSTPYTAAEFVAAWRRMVSVFHDNGATNVGFMWCPNEGGVLLNRTQINTYYPGDAYVDWVGSDWYNHLGGYSTYLHPGWAEFWELFNYGSVSPGAIWSHYDIYGAGRAISGQRGWVGTPHVKPFFVGETATPFDPSLPARKGDWFRKVPAALKTMPNCVGVSFYDCDVHSASDFDWRVDSDAALPNVVGTADAASLAGFVEMARDPYMKGTA